VRSDIIWAKPNPMPESVTDRPTNAHEHVFLLTKSSRYFYDADAVREEHAPPKQNSFARFRVNPAKSDSSRGDCGSGINGTERDYRKNTCDDPESIGRNIRNVWTIATAPFPEAHFATFPPELAERCIRAGTSERGCCAQCGAPWIRTTSVDYTRTTGSTGGARREADPRDSREDRLPKLVKSVETTGWAPSCAHDAPTVPATILDPFAGAGTSLLVADRLQRDAIGIELNPAYAAMARNRLTVDAGMFAEVAD
jgi:DNA modification methylase